jgi:plastocyanin domain-containing protein
MKTALFLLLPLALLACDKKAEPAAGSAASAAAPAVGGAIDVKADENGFTPSNIALKKGEPATLRFKRTTADTCADKVVFPELKLTKDLPVNETVEIPIDTKEAKTLGFECGMGMYKSKVVIQ